MYFGRRVSNDRWLIVMSGFSSLNISNAFFNSDRYTTQVPLMIFDESCQVLVWQLPWHNVFVIELGDKFHRFCGFLHFVLWSFIVFYCRQDVFFWRILHWFVVQTSMKSSHLVKISSRLPYQVPKCKSASTVGNLIPLFRNRLGEINQGVLVNTCGKILSRCWWQRVRTSLGNSRNFAHWWQQQQGAI